MPGFMPGIHVFFPLTKPSQPTIGQRVTPSGNKTVLRAETGRIDGNLRPISEFQKFCLTAG
jgi:hypothetical protein